MSEIRLNKNICTIETSMTVGQIIEILAKKPYAYIVLRRPKQEAGAYWFYVCRPEQLLFWIKNSDSFPNIPDDIEKTPLSYLIDKIRIKSDSASKMLPLMELIPFHETDSAPVVNKKILSWDEDFYRGGWKSANFPVLLQGNKPQGVFDPVQAKKGKLNFLKIKELGYIGKPNRQYADIGGNIILGSESFDVEQGDGDAEFASFADTDIKSTPVGPIHQAYPDIKASNEHPVAGDSIDLEVSLEDVPSETTGGAVMLPNEPPEFVFKMRVHLLCAGYSEWRDLDYSQAKGTIKPAQFTITVPNLTQNAQGYLPDQEKLSVRANFYYENRWCGEGRRDLDLRKNTSIEEMEPAKPEPSIWLKYINIEQNTQPPDLLVRIQQLGDQYIWSFLSPHLEFAGGSETSMKIPNGAETWVKDLFNPYVGVELSLSKKIKITGIGDSIYDITPKAFKDAYWQLFNAAKEDSKISFNSILFISDESSVPWELMRLADLKRNAEIKPEFLGIRHAVGRWIAIESSHLKQNITVQEFVSTGSDYENVDKINKLPWVKEEIKWLEDNYQSEFIPLKFDPINTLLENGKAQAVHFACHGKKSDEEAPLNELIMEDYPETIDPFTIGRWEVQEGLGKQHPMIFLNACEAGATENRLGLIVGLPSAFLKAGASAVISPLWAIGDKHAQEITQQFYKAAFAQDGATLGEILKEIRKKWLSEGNLTFLAYVLYGDPQARITFKPHE